MKAAKIFRLDFLPRSVDLGLLVLRLWVGFAMMLLHGLPKLTGFNEKALEFMDFMGIGQKASLGLSLFAEFFCSILIVLGLFTRFGAFVLAINMSVAFSMAHKGALSGPASGEMAFIYLASYVVLFISGGGRFSMDAKMGGK